MKVCLTCNTFLADWYDSNVCPNRDCMNEDSIIEVDEAIAPLILRLNDNGYKTLYSCAGHVYNKPLADPYVYMEISNEDPRLETIKKIVKEKFKYHKHNTAIKSDKAMVEIWEVPTKKVTRFSIHGDMIYANKYDDILEYDAAICESRYRMIDNIIDMIDEVNKCMAEKEAKPTTSKPASTESEPKKKVNVTVKPKEHKAAEEKEKPQQQKAPKQTKEESDMVRKIKRKAKSKSTGPINKNPDERVEYAKEVTSNFIRDCIVEDFGSYGPTDEVLYASLIRYNDYIDPFDNCITSFLEMFNLMMPRKMRPRRIMIEDERHCRYSGIRVKM